MARVSDGVASLPLDEHLAIVSALRLVNRQELGEAYAKLVEYRAFIEAHGLTPPDGSGADALLRFRHVFRVAGFADDLQANDLTDEWVF